MSEADSLLDRVLEELTVGEIGPALSQDIENYCNKRHHYKSIYWEQNHTFEA